MDVDWVMAVSTAAVALFSLAAVIVSWLGRRDSQEANRRADEALRSAEQAQERAQEARESATGAQWKMSEHLEAIAEAQAKYASNLAAGGTISNAPKIGARLSARMVQRARSDWQFTVANVGTETAKVLSVEEGQGAVLDLHTIEGEELDPGEEMTFPAALTMGTTIPLTVVLRWEDSRGEGMREQKVRPS